jgi:hypothetical protein
MFAPMGMTTWMAIKIHSVIFQALDTGKRSSMHPIDIRASDDA